MRELAPLESLSFFEENLPEFLSKDKEIKSLIVDLRNSLKDKGYADFHANVLKSGKNFIKHIILRSIEYLSDESGAPKNRAIKNIKEYIQHLGDTILRDTLNRDTLKSIFDRSYFSFIRNRLTIYFKLFT